MLAVDKSPEALALAERNRQRHRLANVEVRQSHWFGEVSGAFDLIVSNPPYIDPHDKHLSEGDVRFEPRSALVAANRGLADIELIAAHAGEYLTPEGWLMVEHGWDQGADVRHIFSEVFHKIATHPDLAGRDRITIGQVCSAV